MIGKRWIKGAILSVSLLVLGAELILRSLHSDDPIDRNTSNAPDYKDVGQGGDKFWPGGLLKPSRCLDVFDGYGGTVPWRTNSAGFRSEGEFSRTPAPNTFRILSSGDCSTVGYRVAQGKSFPDLLGKRVESELGRPCDTMIAHLRCPALCLSYMKEEGRKWNPDVLLVNVSIVNDIVESYLTLHPAQIGFMDILEGNELPEHCRIRAPGQGAPTLSFDWFRENSMLLRAAFPSGACTKAWCEVVGEPHLLDPNQGLGFFMKESLPIVEEAWRRFFWALSELSKCCREWGISMIAVLVPVRFQVQKDDWKATATYYGLRSEAFALRLPNRRIVEFCRSRNIHVVDVADRLEKAAKAEKLYLPDGDAHWNTRGHEVVSQIVWAEVEPIMRACAKK